jgi:RNA polymerase sigma-70 factor (ECF subfamily)
VDVGRAFKDHEREIVGIAWRILRSIEDARDVAQDAFVRLVAEARGGVAIENARAWLRRVAVNLAINRLRKRPPPPAPAAAKTDDRRAAIDRAVAELPERQRVVFLLRCEQGLPLAEIAETLGIAPSTAGVHLTRALVALRAKLSEETP